MQATEIVELNEIIEAQIRGLVKTEIKPSQILVGIHNAFVNGSILIDAGWDVSEDNLKEFYDGLEMSISALVKMEEGE